MFCKGQKLGRELLARVEIALVRGVRGTRVKVAFFIPGGHYELSLNHHHKPG